MEITGAGTVIRALRNVHGISQTTLAERIGCSKSTLSKYENGNVPISLDALDRAAGALRMPPEVLLLQCIRFRYRSLSKGGVAKLLDDVLEALEPGSSPLPFATSRTDSNVPESGE